MDVRVVDWFTKVRAEEVNINDVKEKIIKEIKEKSKDKCKNIKNFADVIWDVLERNEDLKRICADSRLPTCSLFHHLKNTAAIAVCMAIDKGYDKEAIQKIRVGSLLHDIGKLESWQENKIGAEHIQATEKIVKNILIDCRFAWLDENGSHYIIRLATRHHPAGWAKEYPPELDYEKLVAYANNIASATDRVYDVIVEGVDRGKCEPTIKSKDNIFPHKITFKDCDFNLENKNDDEIILGRLEEKKVKISLNESFDNRKKSAKVFYDEVVDGYAVKYFGDLKLSGKLGLLLIDVQRIQDFISESMGSTKRMDALRGGSDIIQSLIEKEISEKIAEEVCPEAILFKGGGNLLAFLPSNEDVHERITQKIEDLTKKYELTCAIAHPVYEIEDIGSRFDYVLGEIFDEVELKKNESYDKKPILVNRSDKICSFCINRKANGILNTFKCCEVCIKKIERGKEVKNTSMYKYIKNVIEELNCKAPHELENIGNNIAVIAMDGNMMGRMFQQTMTPAEYNYKSETFDKELKKIFKDFVYEFSKSKEKDVINNGYLSIEPLYVGGDDILLITNTKIALSFAEGFMKKIADRFRFKPKAIKDYETPVVTFSIGIAMAQHKFPIYFLIRKAHELQKKASKAFRENVILDDNLRLYKLPEGAIAFTSVTSAMPSEEKHTFVFPKDEKKFEKLMEYIKYAIEEGDDKKALVSFIINTEKNPESRLNTIKYLYARISAKEKITFKDCENACEIIQDNNMLDALKSAVPMVWHSKKENE